MSTEPRELSASDILEEASCVSRFLADIAPLLHAEGPHIGITEKGACGLYYILNHLHNDIELAVSKM